MLLAAIDYGTVTSRLLIADLDETGIHQLLKKTIITHLGEGLAQTGQISADAISRVVAASQSFMAEIQAVNQDSSTANQVQAVRAVATSAMRDAANSDEVVKQLAELGIDVRIIAGSDEARLSFSGTTTGFGSDQIADTTVLVADIGGGSTELIVGRVASDGVYPQILEAVSLNIGARRITDNFLLGDPPTADELAAARDFVRQQLAGFFLAVEQREIAIDSVIAVAGTATTAVSIRERMQQYDAELVHGQTVSATDLRTMIADLSALNLAARSQVVGLQQGRAPVVIGGMLILDELLTLARQDGFIASETDILQGILLDTWQQLRVM